MAIPGPSAAPPRERASLRRLRGMWAIVWRLLAWFALWAVLAGACIVPVRVGLAGWVRAHALRAQIWGDVTMALTLLLASWLMARFADRAGLAALGLSGRCAGRLAARGVLLGTAWIAASLALARLAGCLSWQPVGHFVPLALAGAIVSLAANALCQQLLLNGYLLHVLRGRIGTVAALGLAAGLFTLLHAPAFRGAWLPVVNVFAAGLLFLLARLATGSVWLPLGMHAAWNVLLGPGLGLSVSGTDQLARGWRVFAVHGPTLLAGGAFGLEGGAFVTLTTLLAAAIAAGAWRARRARDRTKAVPDTVGDSLRS